MTRERCTSCGGSTFINAIDNHGQSYRGCAMCRVGPPTNRVTLDLAVVTVEELLSCVHDRIARCQQAGVEVPHITKVAGKMLREALGRSAP